MYLSLDLSLSILTGMCIFSMYDISLSSAAVWPGWTCVFEESMFDKNDARVEQERAEAEEKRQRRDALGFQMMQSFDVTVVTDAQ